MDEEDSSFALVTFLLIFVGGGVYFVCGTLVNSRCALPRGPLHLSNRAVAYHQAS